jgi:hypothetical protein
MEYQDVMNLTNDFITFYESIDDITEYYLKKKQERLSQNDYPNIEGSVFKDYSIPPSDLDISIEVVENKIFQQYTTQIATFPIESQIGRKITIGVKENNTNTWLGFIRIASPVSSIKPRNDFFGGSLPLDVVNNHFYNGQTIVPVQPFGYNYLGGKLLALICSSNEVKKLFNDRYNTNISIMETTSLYGSSKSSSMYDGLEPYIKFKGLTESKNILTPTDEIYFNMRDKIRLEYGVSEWGGSVVNPKGSSPKTRELNKLLQILKIEVKNFDVDLYKVLDNTIKTKSITKQQKRYYLSTFGVDNIQNVIMNNQIVDDVEKHNLENLINWWKTKSQKRWDNLNNKNQMKNNLELYTRDSLERGINFTIIR